MISLPRYHYSSYKHSLLFFSLSILLPFVSSILDNTLSTNEFLTPWSNRTLISPNSVFQLGFFRLASENGDGGRWYLGMWYRAISKRDYVWVANRDNPLSTSTGTLKISNANLVLFDQSGATLWSTNVTTGSPGSPVVAELLANGNFVLRYSKNNPKEYLWQSFDYPTDTLLPEMKLGWDDRTNLNRILTSWKSKDDPSSGDFSYKIDTHGLPQRVIWERKLSSSLYHRSDSFNRVGSNGILSTQQTKNIMFNFTITKEEVTYSFRVTERSFYSKLKMSFSGTLERLVWPPTTQKWISLWNAPTDLCDRYATCGSNSVCNMGISSKCECIKGFEPRDKKAWSYHDVKSGCKRKTRLSCAGNGFLKLKKVKLPDTKAAIAYENINLKECRKICIDECNCTGYANLDTQNSWSGCLIWKAELIDIRIFTADGQDMYVKLAFTDLGEERSIYRIGLIIAGITVTIIFSFVMLWLWKRKQKRARAIVGTTHQVRNTGLLMNVMSSKKYLLGATENVRLPQMEFKSIVTATDNFSYLNKLGEGGFGIVYKGRLLDGRDIAVKRLTKVSVHGTNQFRNEANLIARLQHINLVRVLGYCDDADEQILIYEYLENRSLSSYLFDNTQSFKLNGQRRIEIVNGIAHQDSRFRIIHRDLKASNILLDKDMIPKISDFGMARLIGREETEAKTTTLAGTFGYMAPEYMRDGIFSVKSDVFSFGVLLLEIVTGKRNWSFISNGEASLLTRVWRHWEAGTLLEIADPCIVESSSPSNFQIQKVLRCFQVGLLCAQEIAENRPTMPSVVLMLESEAAIPQPQPFSFCGPGSNRKTSFGDTGSSSSINDISLSVIEAR